MEYLLLHMCVSVCACVCAFKIQNLSSCIRLFEEFFHLAIAHYTFLMLEVGMSDQLCTVCGEKSGLITWIISSFCY